MQKLTRDEMAQRVARDIPEGAYVNLGIGLPTRIANYLPADKEIFLHSENGLLGMGPKPLPGEEDPELINAGKEYVTLLNGGCYFHHGDSFAMMRGGHLDICVLGAYQVSASGDLANWSTGAPDAIPAVGGAMDLAIGARQVFVMMDHLTREGECKLVEHCTYPKARKEPMMNQAFICDAVRTPFGRFGGTLATLRADDLAALPLKALLERNPGLDPARIDDVIYGCANQAGEDNRNVARMALLLAGLPESVPGSTVNRLCGSSLDAIGIAARAIKSGETQLMIAGGVESMSRAPFVMGKAESAFSRTMRMEDTTIGWRFINPQMKALYGVDSMPETAENVADDFAISREDQDAFALRSQLRTAAAQEAGRFADELIAVSVPQRKGEPLLFSRDEHPRSTTAEALARLRGVVRADGTVTAGNASGVNDGACALLLASEQALAANDLQPLARVVGVATAGVAPRIMGFGPAPAVRKVLAQTGLTLGQMDVIELNEAFAAQALAVTRDLGLPDDAAHVNPNGGAIALGHPLGASGGRLAMTAAYQLRRTGGRYALCTMCIGVGQGIALIIERV